MMSVTITRRASSRLTASVQPGSRTLNGLFRGAVRSITSSDPGINPISINLSKLSEVSSMETILQRDPIGTLSSDVCIELIDI